MSGRSASLPSSASAGGQELQPCEVNSSTAHGPVLASAAASRAVSRPAPAIKTERLPSVDMVEKWARGRLPTNQQTVRLALRNIITKWHARPGLRRHLSPRHERLS